MADRCSAAVPILLGEQRNLDGFSAASIRLGCVDHTTVQATALQYADGRIDDGSGHEPPHVYLGDDALTSVQARELAAALIETADEVDRWAQRDRLR
jgi:hypothetical protein